MATSNAPQCDTRAARYRELRDTTAKLYASLYESRAHLHAKWVRVRDKHMRENRDMVKCIYDNDDKMYDYRRRAARHLCREITRTRKQCQHQKLDRRREERAVEKLTVAYDAHVNPDDMLRRILPAPLQQLQHMNGPII